MRTGAQAEASPTEGVSPDGSGTLSITTDQDDVGHQRSPTEEHFASWEALTMGCDPVKLPWMA